MRYQFRDRAEAHFIEIVPNEIYHLDENYILWESEMYDRFSNYFPTQGICFVSNDDFVGVENAEFTFCGNENYS
ncbi:hypothetical protein FACS1894195_5370 [Bacteroidia bacterium]|nr:hypothetical protein FACS1894195_5370 [Bacteroidia bacterium]